MGLDIRIPLGLIFHLNLTWGAVMFVFGLIMFLVGRRQKWQDDPVTPRPWEREGGPPRH
jgi:hypothetical protein